MSAVRGFGESGAVFDASNSARSAQTVIGAEGRVLIPAGLREAAGIRKGEKVVLRVQEDGVIVIETLLAQVRRSQAIMAQYLRADGTSVVDEFIAERRAEAAGE